MKIWCQLPGKTDLESDIIKTINQCFNVVKRADTEITIRALDSGLNHEYFSFPGLRFLNDREILRNALRSERAGYDALVIACFFDPALFGLRQLMNIPVIGIAESSMHYASIMGRKFAIITSDSAYIGELEENIDKYGMRNQVISRNAVRAIKISCGEFFGCVAGDYNLAIESCKEVAYDCIHDGAQALIAGCGLLSPMLTKMGIFEIGGVPIIDPMIIGIKFAEMMADIHKAKIPIISRKHFYINTPDDIINATINM